MKVHAKNLKAEVFKSLYKQNPKFMCGKFLNFKKLNDGLELFILVQFTIWKPSNVGNETLQTCFYRNHITFMGGKKFKI